MTSRRVHVGTPRTSASVQEWESTDVCVHGFADLPLEVGEEVDSPEFACLGHMWSLCIFPGDTRYFPASSDKAISVELWNMADDCTEFDVFFAVRNSVGREVTHCAANFRRSDNNYDKCWGGREFAKRSTLVEALVEGTLTVEVWMRIRAPADACYAPFVPENQFHKNIRKKFMDEASADVIFEVVNGHGRGARASKRAKTAPATLFHAHSFILQESASTLAELCEPGGEEVLTVQIADVVPVIFRIMLYHLYGGKSSKVEVKANAKQLIDAADKYGIVSLKLEAEVCYVESTKLTVANILDNLLYAHSKNCALLKEAVMDYIVKKRSEVMDKVSFDDVPGSIVKDLLAAVERGAKDNDPRGASHYNRMRVGTLRKMLDEKGLDVDGSREAMIALLKDN